ncbi:uncharacterized protein BO66DRAFT_117999 [Aspergillus aculeatinus CBS 121060]|uniref:Uncharacterized protein n=1 Tax=Aspergillus aculeatinus CBS 121060 TaxID=1448322 RepID=A0ACD1H604_9EURO|nr:hypothetical protein BO66DRAFT_117999 [Aspergillus aculeatinus CBS 121060]RAH68938.1 hypothetical protein BO66DRAFT_117999 [Aspergillus aculeatinus CBS 121060]
MRSHTLTDRSRLPINGPLFSCWRMTRISCFRRCSNRRCSNLVVTKLEPSSPLNRFSDSTNHDLNVYYITVLGLILFTQTRSQTGIIDTSPFPVNFRSNQPTLFQYPRYKYKQAKAR